MGDCRIEERLREIVELLNVCEGKENMIYLLLGIATLFLIEKVALYLYCRWKKCRHIQPADDEKKTAVSSNAFRNRISNLLGGYIRYRMMILGRVPCHAYRNFILRNVFQMSIGENAVIYGGFEIRAPWNISIGKGSIIGDESKLDGRNGIRIGENVNLSTGVWIWTEQHDLNDPYFRCNDKGGEVIIEDRAWISSRVTVLPGVHIGEKAVVAANALVCKDINSCIVAAGVPAEEIGVRNDDMKYVFDGTHLSFW